MKTKVLTLALLAILGAGSAQASIITMGTGASAFSDGAIAIGDGATCSVGGSYYSCTAIGKNARVRFGGVALGEGAFADSIGDTAIDGDKSTAIGINSHAEMGAIAIGHDAFATNMKNTDWQRSIAIGTSAVATDGSISIGSYSNNNGRSNAFSVGNSAVSTRRNGSSQGPIYRQVINVGAGTQDHDAVIVQQVIPAVGAITSTLGGGATYDPISGAYTGPTYDLSTGTYTTVYDALKAIDNKPAGPGGGTNKLNPGTNIEVVDNGDGTQTANLSDDVHLSDQGSLKVGTTTVDGDGVSLLGGPSMTSNGIDAANLRITSVANGQADTDAANMGQVRAVDTRVSQTQSVLSNAASWFGGGASYDPATGAFMGPSYTFQSGATYTDVGSALADLDGRVAALEALPPGGGAQGPAGPAGPAGSDGQDGASAYQVAVESGFEGTEEEWLASLQGADGKDGRDGVDGKDGGTNKLKKGSNIELADNEDGTQTASLSDNVELSDKGSVKVGATTVNGDGVSIQGGPSMTRDGIDAGGQRITSVANGRIEQGSTDAVNGGQLWNLQQQWDDRWTEINNRFDRTNKRMDGLGAQMGAMTMMAATPGEGGMTVGVGMSGSQAAMAVGWSRRINDRVSVSLGASFGGGNKPVVGGAIRIGGH